jgi:hypothetical protein
MNALKLISAAVAAAAVMASCSNDEPVTGDGQVEVRFSASTAEIHTRVTEPGWTAAVGIYMIGESGGLVAGNIGADNRPYSAFTNGNSTEFRPVDNPIYYSMSGNVKFIAYYPYQSPLTDFKLPVSVVEQDDQSVIDVLYAPAGDSYNKNSGQVPLAFTHSLVKLAFTVTCGNGVTESLVDLTVKITGQQTAAELNLTDGTVDATGDPMDITAKRMTESATEATAEAMALPNSSVSNMTFTFTTSAGEAYEAAVPVPAASNNRWEPGMKYSYNVILKRDEVIVTGSTDNWTLSSAHNVTGISPVVIEGYGGDVKIQYSENEHVIIESVTLIDYSNTKYFIGRAVDAGNPVRLKFDSSNDGLVFRDPVNGYIPIGSYAEFRMICDNDGTGHKYRQEADLDLMNEEWVPITTDGSDFDGEYDGAGKKISHLKIDKSGKNNQGLFHGNKGTICNVHIVSGTITAGVASGGICGANKASGKIISCINAATVLGSGIYVGGVVGNNEGAVTACYNTGTVLGIFRIGGVAGYNNGTVTACYNTGMVEGSNYVGSVIGYNNSSVTACYWKESTAGNGIGLGNGSTSSFTDDSFAPSESDAAWGTGTGETNGYWKEGTTGGGQLPKLWYE